jgi:hypothetical protein
VMVCVDIGAGAIDIWVESNGRKLEEYKLEALDAHAKQECYIASVVDEVILQHDCPTYCPLMQSSCHDRNSVLQYNPWG